MIKFFRKIRQKLIKENRFSKYLLYAIGEILLIIIGILIAVNIDQSIKESKAKEERCIYLNELLYTFEFDIKDVEENIGAFDTWNPMIQDLLVALVEDKLEEVDSLNHKFGTVGNYISFGQRSKSKIEELKYSNNSLIENRELKNKILLYQNNNISHLKALENSYNLIGEDIRKYYMKNFVGFNYGLAYPINMDELKQDNTYRSLVYQRLSTSLNLRNHHNNLLKEQREIHKLLVDEIENNCK